jgi:tetratricopeptide (TPR) repeat protein
VASVVDRARAATRKRRSVEARPAAALREMGRLIDSAQYDEAISLGMRLLGRSLRPRHEAEVRFGIGRALVQKVDAAGAQPHLTRARALFERLGDAWMVAHVLGQEAVALFLTEDSRSLSVGLTALDRCDQLDPPARELRAAVNNTIANFYLRDHDWRNSIRFYEQGLAGCRDLVSLRLVARLNDGLSIARQQMGDWDGALAAAERAHALYAGDTDSLGRVRAENNLGHVLLKQGRLDAAAHHLNRALDMLDEHDLWHAGGAYVLGSMGELHLARQEPRLACPHLTRSLELATRFRQRVAQADAYRLLGQTHAQLDDDDAAQRHFTTAIDLFRQMGLTQRLCKCATEYAEVLCARNRFNESIVYWRIASGAHRPETSPPGAVTDPLFMW